MELQFPLWFAWKIVLLQYRKQPTVVQDLRLQVVICLKNRTFAVSQTTPKSTSFPLWWLWFAWKIVLLQYRKQPYRETAFAESVVICLKNRTFAVSQTTGFEWWHFQFQLWFAWKIVLLQYRKQQDVQGTLATAGCDLLEKSYFCSIANNKRKCSTTPLIVVICLKNRTFAVSQTTHDECAQDVHPLWFAWKIVLLQYRKQRMRALSAWRLGCDLLEKSYFCSIANNGYSRLVLSAQLWFAWKIVLLQYRKQRWNGWTSR